MLRLVEERPPVPQPFDGRAELVPLLFPAGIVAAPYGGRRGCRAGAARGEIPLDSFR